MRFSYGPQGMAGDGVCSLPKQLLFLNLSPATLQETVNPASPLPCFSAGLLCYFRVNAKPLPAHHAIAVSPSCLFHTLGLLIRTHQAARFVGNVQKESSRQLTLQGQAQGSQEGPEEKDIIGLQQDMPGLNSGSEALSSSTDSTMSMRTCIAAVCPQGHG